jgi:hypothetical protein
MRFRYLQDPLFLASLILYAVNRWFLKRAVASAFLHDHLNDLLCIPFWVPIMLWAMRKGGLRNDNAPPRSYEILVPLVVWSLTFEVLLPRLGPFQHLAHADPFDVLAYAVGALIAAVFWRLWYAGDGWVRHEQARVRAMSPAHPGAPGTGRP